MPIERIIIKKDDLNDKPWGDVICKRCRFVIATVSADEEGELIFKPKETK
jgi:hypothetical protein